ncbi:MAG: hypothetical protein ACFNL6_01930 [Candidatus Nanoperiomorbus sp.]
MNRSSVTYEPEEGRKMKFSEHDKMILSGKVAKPTFRGNITPMRGGSRKSHRKNIKPGKLDVREQLRRGLLDEVDDA